MPWARASEADRWIRCPSSLLLPRVDRESGEGAAWGNGMHRLWQRDEIAPEPGYDRHGPQLEERRGAVERCREKFWPGWDRSRPTDTTEVTIAIFCGVDGDDDDMVRCVRGLSDEERDAWKAAQPDPYITGSIDHAHESVVLGDPFFSDLNTGRYEERGPRQRGQFWVYALAMYLLTGADRVVSNVVRHPRYPKGEDPTALWATFTGLELDGFHDLLRRKYREHCTLKLGGEGAWGAAAKPGDHCTFCDAKAACTAAMGAA